MMEFNLNENCVSGKAVDLWVYDHCVLVDRLLNLRKLYWWYFGLLAISSFVCRHFSGEMLQKCLWLTCRPYISLTI